MATMSPRLGLANRGDFIARPLLKNQEEVLRTKNRNTRE
jgi:hypothetical protein